MAAPMEKSRTMKGKKKGKKHGNSLKKEINLKPKDNEIGDESAEDSYRDSPLTLKVKGTWKTVDVDLNLLNEDELNEFCGLEELTDYELLKGFAPTDDSTESQADTSSDVNKKGQKRKQTGEATKVPKKKAKVQQQTTKDEVESDIPGISTVSGQIICRSRTLGSDEESEDGDDEDGDEDGGFESTNKTKKKQEKGKKAKNVVKETPKPSTGDSKKERTDSDNVVKGGKPNKNSKKTKNAGVDKSQGKPTAQQQTKQQRMAKQGDESGNMKKDEGSYTKGLHVPQRKQALDMSAWKSLAITSPVLKALEDMGFTKPSPIQSACIPAAIKKHRDIMGAAETGSGKTLAFGIPILNHILKLKEKQHRQQQQQQQRQQQQDHHSDGQDADEDSNDEDEAAEGDSDEDSSNEDSSNEDSSNQSEENLYYEDDDEEELEWEEEEEEEEEKEKEMPQEESKVKVEKRTGDLLGLVMAPTRELAVQVKNHLVAAAKYTGITVAVICGGVSAEKQKRILKKRPEIVVGTPGRLWELFSERDPYLATMAHVRYLVIDEADRMVERGHYLELANIMDLLNGSHMQKKRQTFIFSATLTMVHVGPRTAAPTNNPNKKDKTKLGPRTAVPTNNPNKKDKTKLDTVLSKVSVRQNAKVVDLTSKEGTVASLLEGKIVCNLSEKDIYLYYFLLQYPGRTLVFTNSIETIRHMISILTLLQCNPLPLHSSMHQRQRLKNLDRFASNPRGLLISTDVAARGLDIPNVQHVIHYHVPKTSETYVHRSGRTARQAKEGLSIMLVSAQEVKSFRKVCKALNRNDLPNFPTELKFYEAVKERVTLARQVDKLELSVTKKKKQNQWYENAAKELDVELDDWIINDMGSDADQKQHNSEVKYMRGQLKSLLKNKLFPRWSSQLYPTLDGALVQPFVASDSAAAMSSFKTRISKDKAEDDARKEKKKRKFRKFQRNKKFKAQAAGSS